MSMLNAYYQETVIIHSNTSDNWNERHEVNSTVSAKVNWEHKKVKNSNGEDDVSEVQLYLDKNVSIDFDDMVTVDGVRRPVMTIRKPRAFTNAYGHTVVFLGKKVRIK